MENDLDEARQRVENIRAHLPVSVSVAALGVRQKTPFQLLVAREAMIWRTEELARGACDMLEIENFAAGILLTRAVIENAAFVWRLNELLERRRQYSPEQLRENCERMLLGWKKKGEPALPEAFNVLTFIDHLDRKIPGVRDSYDQLSEFAHPNWSGVSGLFSANDRANYVTNFGRGLPSSSTPKKLALNSLNASLEIFEHAYNSISDLLPAFLGELEPLFGPEETNSGG
jgi:hypothetical protein